MILKAIMRIIIAGLIVIEFGQFLSGIYLYKAFEHLRKQQMSLACGYFITASVLNPFDPQGFYFAGTTIALSGDYKGAVEFYDQVRKRAPDFLLTNRLRQEAIRRMK